MEFAKTARMAMPQRKTVRGVTRVQRAVLRLRAQRHLATMMVTKPASFRWCRLATTGCAHRNIVYLHHLDVSVSLRDIGLPLWAGWCHRFWVHRDDTRNQMFFYTRRDVLTISIDHGTIKKIYAFASVFTITVYSCISGGRWIRSFCLCSDSTR